MARGAPLFPEPRVRPRLFRGLTERQERIFEELAFLIVLAFVTGWAGAIAHQREVTEDLRRQAARIGVRSPSMSIAPTQRIATSLLDRRAPATAYINEAMLGFLNPLRGESGKVRFTTITPGQPIVPERPGSAAAVLSRGTSREVSPDFTAPDRPGLYNLAVQVDRATRAIEDFSVITLVPFAEKKRDRIGLYYLGNWPYERGGRPRSERYAVPQGFIEVTRENQNTYISEHFRLRDFLTKDQPDVWPKYLLLDPKLIDKLELIVAEIERSGRPVERMAVMSGFRTPRYNHSGGNTAGRANLSRHMYGDAADIYVDNDGNGNMDDLTRDGRVDTRDAEFIRQAADRVERDHPSLVGGVGVYSACCGHGPFTHIDVRGYRARWRGSGNG